MTETSILPGSAVGSDPPTTVPAPFDVQDAEAGSDRRRLLMLGGAGGAVVVAAAAYFLLHGGSSSTPDTAPVTPVQHIASAAPKTATATSVKPAPLPKRARHASAVRDPFKALVTAPAAISTQVGATQTVAGSSADAATIPSTSSGTTPTSTSTTTTSVPVVTQPTSPSTGAAPTSGTSGPPQWLRLVSTNSDKTATFEVGYSHHKFRKFVVHAPKANSGTGTVFDGEFALIGIQDGTATVQVGDATPFDLSKGVQRDL